MKEDMLKDLYINCFTKTTEYEDVNLIVKGDKTLDTLWGVMCHLEDDEDMMVDLENAILKAVDVGKMQGWISGYKYAMQMMMACGFKAGDAV